MTFMGTPPTTQSSGFGATAPPLNSPFGAPPSNATLQRPFGSATTASDDSAAQVTIVGKSARPLDPDEGAPGGQASFMVAPSAGDATTPNNFFELKEHNACCAHVRITLGGNEPAQPGSTPDKKELNVLPDQVRLTTVVTKEGAIVFDLQVEVTNPMSCVAAAVLDVPRLPGLLLLEEEHHVGAVHYAPKVMQKEQADAAFQQAAASQTHSASLGAVEESSFSVKLDKIPPKATATFGVKLLQSGGLRSFGAVVADGDASSSDIADVTILPSYAPLDGRGVPFDFSLRFDEAFECCLPAAEVMRHEARAMASQRSVDVSSVLFLAPEAVEGDGPSRLLRWRHTTGLARGTLLRARLVRKRDDASLATGLSALGAAPVATPRVESVDTFCGAYYSPQDGSASDASLIALRVPSQLPGVAPNAAPHQLTVIVDTSGSTGRSARGGGNVLDASKGLLRAILRALPEHINTMRARGAINGQPVTLRLWHFDSTTIGDAEVAVGGGVSSEAAIAQVVAKLDQLRPGGVTNYDSWAKRLSDTVAAQPSALHSVLLVTDGGATQRERFVESIEAIGAMPDVGFFQVDCLGYGPWLDQRTVSYLASATGGEALMVEEVGGSAMQTKVVGLLARSMLRAGSQLTMRVSGALLAAKPADGERPPSATPSFSSLDAFATSPPGYDLNVLPGSMLQLLVLHPSGALPPITISGAAVEYPPAVASPAAAAGSADTKKEEL